MSDPVSDNDRPGLRPATAREIEEGLSFPVRHAGHRRAHHADGLMAGIAAGRLVRHLEQSGRVPVRRPGKAAPGTSGHLRPSTG